MFLFYNEQTKRILHWSNTTLLATTNLHLTELVKYHHVLFGNSNDSMCVIANGHRSSMNYYNSSWLTHNNPLELYNLGDINANYMAKYFKLEKDTRISMLERNCDPLIEEPNLITENWIHYCGIYSTKSDEIPERLMDLPRFVLTTTATLHKLYGASWDITYKHFLYRPNIVVSTATMPYSEEDWEWIKIRDTIIRVIKPVPKYRLSMPYCNYFPQYHTSILEDVAANAGVYCAPIVSGDIKENDHVYVYYNPKNNLNGPYNYTALEVTFLLAVRKRCARAHLLYFHYGSQKPYQIR
ncbi:hypothetical protein ALC62_06152 [Cyphomyrmex costatus]|uniref:Uncharacterized protein n=1 Tax=Cyphomyrmex costatus TaxID=456900 RepID=A0A195CRD5_9HYME|nr:hypothetical protein ALC62_06152 [Cyphomyrmex costatus]